MTGKCKTDGCERAPIDMTGYCGDHPSDEACDHVWEVTHECQVCGKYDRMPANFEPRSTPMPGPAVSPRPGCMHGCSITGVEPGCPTCEPADERTFVDAGGVRREKAGGEPVNPFIPRAAPSSGEAEEPTRFTREMDSLGELRDALDTFLVGGPLSGRLDRIRRAYAAAAWLREGAAPPTPGPDSTLADQLEDLAFRVESRAAKHECMGADCARCWPNGIGDELRAIVERLRNSKPFTRPAEEKKA